MLQKDHKSKRGLYMKMKYSKILLCMTALFCLAFQAFAQDPLGAGSSGSSMGSSGDYISPNMGQVAAAA